MKKFICIAICVAILLFLCGCRTYNTSGRDIKGNDDRITYIFNDGFVIVMRDNETGVCYLGRASMGITVMFNADGTVLTDKVGGYGG